MNRARWLPLVAFAGLLVLLAAGVWLSRDPDRDALPSTLIGQPAPEFTLPLLHAPEQTLSSAQLRGQPYLLNVWGSWCPECRVEHAVVDAIRRSGTVRVIGYNWKDEQVDALRWLEQFGNPYESVIVDREGVRAIDWGIYGAPETFLVDADGVVRWKHVGALTDAVVMQELMPLVDELRGRR